MLAQNIENGFFAIKAEMKEKEFELLKELDLAIKHKSSMKKMKSSVELVCEGRIQAYTKIYEKLFGVLQKNKDDSPHVLALEYRIKSVFKELKKFLDSK